VTEWEINDKTSKLLKSNHAPHETGGALRTHRAGWPGEAIAKELKTRPFKLLEILRRDKDAEDRALTAGRDIYDALINTPKEKS